MISSGKTVRAVANDFLIIYLALLAVSIISFVYYILNAYYSTYYIKGDTVSDVDPSETTKLSIDDMLR